MSDVGPDLAAIADKHERNAREIESTSSIGADVMLQRFAVEERLRAKALRLLRRVEAETQATIELVGSGKPVPTLAAQVCAALLKASALPEEKR